jgi:ADP-ribose pyrophosphatase
MNYTIETEDLVFDDFLKVHKATVNHDRFDHGEMRVKRLALDRGDSIAVLIKELDTESFIFTKQFRYPSSRRSQPWMLEIPAGAVDQDEHPEAAARRETQEETGYNIDSLEKITTYFPSPGMASEQITLFYAEVNSKDKIEKGGGSAQENEDIAIIKIPAREIRAKLKDGFFNNSISIISLQWYLLNKL